jgi:hypothetical protein
LVDPGGQAYPGAQGPTHPALDTPLTLPNRPASHGAVQAAVASPGLPPYRPTGQSVQVPAAAREYRPAGQMAAVGLTDPATQAYPAVHGPLQPASTAPGPLPNRPGAHCPVQAAEVAPGLDPNRPGAHRVHVPAPGPLYRPTGHNAPVPLVDPGAHA